MSKRDKRHRRDDESITGQCVYCGEVRVLEEDHVPSKNLFPKPRPSNLVTVPSCARCNRGFSKDDEYFRTAASLILDGRKDPRLRQLFDKSLSAFKRPESGGLKSLFYSTFNMVEVRGDSGLYYGNALSFTVDLERIRRYACRTIRGLYFAETGVRLPTTTGVLTIVNEPLPQPETIVLLVSQPEKEVGRGIFYYKHVLAPDEPLASAWLLVFYEKLVIFGLTLPVPPPMMS